MAVRKLLEDVLEYNPNLLEAVESDLRPRFLKSVCERPLGGIRDVVGQFAGHTTAKQPSQPIARTWEESGRLTP